MTMHRVVNRLPLAALFLLGAVPGLARAQSAPAPDNPATPHAAPTLDQPKRSPSPADDFAGLQYTDEQKAKINAIDRDIRSREAAVIKDEKLDPDQKRAMLEGYRRIERNEVLEVLTPQQQAEVHKKMLARRATAREESQKKQQQYPPRSAPPIAAPGGSK